MTEFHPPGYIDLGTSAGRCDQSAELARLHWRLTDHGDPYVVLGEFLSRYGLALPTASPPLPAIPHADQEICGAALFISAAASAFAVGAPTGKPSPVPAVPDLVAVVYAHQTGHRTGGRTAHGTGVGVGVGSWHVAPWRSSWPADAHRAAIHHVRAAIAAGEVYQVNVVSHAWARYSGDPGPALRRLTALPGARNGGLLTGPGWAIASASPETLVRVADGIVHTLPIKGTRPATERGRRELLASLKERAEHIMIVDLARNDLAQVAVTGSVRVPDLFTLRRWCHLWQAESHVVAAVRAGAGLPELLRAICPGGSVTGTPKIAALARIADLEPVGRGASMGAMGWLDHRSLDLGLTIRTVAADGERLHLWAGGGITWDSDADDEVVEAAAKARPLQQALADEPVRAGRTARSGRPG